MFSFLASHYILGGGFGLLVIGIIVVAVIGGPALLLNRWTLGAIAAVVLFLGVGTWWGIVSDDLRDEGAKACHAENDAALAARREAVSGLVVDLSAKNQQLQESLRATLSALDLASAERGRTQHVSPKADAACPIPLGFVRDHNAGLPDGAGHPPLPDPKAGRWSDDAPTAVVLSTLGRCIDHNYTEAGKLEQKLAACEQQRYEACLAWDKRFGVASGCTR